MKNSSINWTHHTFNPWQGCSKVSTGCTHCYAESLSNRWGKDIWGPGKARQRTSLAYWKQPIAWNKEASASGERKRVFCASMADVFDEAVPNLWRFDLFDLIEKTPHLDWLLLTKRPENISSSGLPYLENVWLGTSVENQKTANERIPALTSVRAVVHFLSCEPLLEAIDLEYPESVWPDGPARCCDGRDCGCMGMPIDPPLMYDVEWIIIGGESGPCCRPMNPEWASEILGQCNPGSHYHTAVWIKQMGGHPSKREALRQIPESLRVRELPVKHTQRYATERHVMKACTNT
jgi:protein gp37